MVRLNERKILGSFSWQYASKLGAVDDEGSNGLEDFETAQAVRIQEKKRTDMGRSWSAVHPNTFRKYWKNRMIEAGSDQRLVLHMMGHRIPRVLGSYEPTDDELLETYAKAESKLGVL